MDLPHAVHRIPLKMILCCLISLINQARLMHDFLIMTSRALSETLILWNNPTALEVGVSPTEVSQLYPGVPSLLSDSSAGTTLKIRRKRYRQQSDRELWTGVPYSFRSYHEIHYRSGRQQLFR